MLICLLVDEMSFVNFNLMHTRVITFVLNYANIFGSILQSKSNLSHDFGVSSMFWALSLATHDCNLELGMTKSFKDIIPRLPSVSP